jgi:hypothetical protein
MTSLKNEIHAPDFDVMQSPLKIGVRDKVLSSLKSLNIK